MAKAADESRATGAEGRIAGDLNQTVDSRDGDACRGECLRPLAQATQRLGLGNVRAPQHVVVAELLGFLARVARGRERGGWAPLSVSARDRPISARAACSTRSVP